MKRARILLAAFAALMLGLFSACASGEGSLPGREGKYGLSSYYFLGERYETGGKLKEEDVLLVLKEDGGMTFSSKAAYLGFTLEGTWTSSEEGAELSCPELSAPLSAVFDGDTVTVEYEGAIFTLKKVRESVDKPQVYA